MHGRVATVPTVPEVGTRTDRNPADRCYRTPGGPEARARPRPIRRSLARSFSSCRAVALSGPIRSAPTRLCTKPASSRTGDRHLDRRDQCRPDRRQRSSGPDVAAAGILGSDAAQPLDGNVGGLAVLGPLACRLTTVAHGIPAFFQTKRAGLPRAPRAARAGCGGLLRHLAARPNACRARGRGPDQPGRDPFDRWSRERPHQRNAVLRQPRHGHRSSPRDGLRGLPPAFPAIRIDEDLYWDGGILSNTPVEAVFDDNPRRNSVVFAVHLEP